LLSIAIVCSFAKADAQYYTHTLFDNSLEPDAYYYSSGKASGSSTLELIHGKLPVSRGVFYTPPNALRLKWRSVPEGGWEAGISAINFRNREIIFHGDTLFFWCFSKEGISTDAMPLIEVSDTGPGVPPAVRPKLFDAFFTSDRAGGTGLGLVIAADLVHAHGGSLTLAPPARADGGDAETEPPGARFIIILPRPAADADASAPEGAPARGAANFETTTS